MSMSMADAASPQGRASCLRWTSESTLDRPGHGGRVRWTPAQNLELARLLAETNSLVLASHRFDRTRSAVNTRASLMGLLGDRAEHVGLRRPWTAAEEAKAVAAVEAATCPAGRIDIAAAAAAVGRTVDGLLERLLGPLGWDVGLLDLLDFSQPVPAAPRAPRQPPAPGTARRCLRCQEMFPSEGIHNRVCGPCKRSDEWP